MNIEIEIPFIPPSANALYRSYRGRVITSKKYKMFKESMIEYLQHIHEPFLGQVQLFVTFYITDKRKHDLDNLLKGLIDTLQPTCILNDNQIMVIHAEKMLDQPDARTLIHISEFQ